MGSGTGLLLALARTLAHWRQAWRKPARSERLPEERIDRALADAALSRADLDSARAQVRSDILLMMRLLDVVPIRIAQVVLHVADDWVVPIGEVDCAVRADADG